MKKIILYLICVFSLISFSNGMEKYNKALQYDEEGKYELAEKYYLMAIDDNNIEAMNDLSEKYYKLAIDNKYLNATYNLGLLYYEEKNMIYQRNI